MDSITHICLGAVVGEILAGKTIGKKAMLIGAFAQSLPDIDVVAGLWMSPDQYFLAHRGFSHSFLFVALASGALSWSAGKLISKEIGLRFWFVFFFIQLLIHVLIDSLNAYGTGWLEPFSHMRVSFDLLFVVDPFFSIWLGIAFLLLVAFRITSPGRMRLAVAALALSFTYTIYAAINKSGIAKAANQSFELQHISPSRILITPTPLNCWLWYIVAEVHDGYFIGYRSTFDRDPSVNYQYFPRNDSLIDPIRGEKDVKSLLLLARDFYTVDRHHDTILFNNLRFGQINGWHDAKGEFVFRYRLGAPNSVLTVQRGRFSGWNQTAWRNFIERICGN